MISAINCAWFERSEYRAALRCGFSRKVAICHRRVA
jgi:hypothetical protein